MDMTTAESSNSQGMVSRHGRLSLGAALLLLAAVALVSSNTTEAAKRSSRNPARAKTVQTPGEANQTARQDPTAVPEPRQILLDVLVITMNRRDLSKLGTWHEVTLSNHELAVSPAGRAGGTESNGPVRVRRLCPPDPVSGRSLVAEIRWLEKRRRL